MPEWSFLTNHARVLVCIAQDPGARLRDIAGELSITERSAFSIVRDLVEAVVAALVHPGAMDVAIGMRSSGICRFPTPSPALAPSAKCSPSWWAVTWSWRQLACWPRREHLWK